MTSSGSRWIVALTVGAAVLAPSAARAQRNPAPGSPATGATGPATPGTGSSTRTRADVNPAPPPPIRPGQPISVLVFPFGYATDDAAAPAADPNAAGAGAGPRLTAGQQRVAQLATAGVKAALLSTPAYSVVTYHAQSPLIQRARQSEILRAIDVADVVSPSGAVNVEKARTMASRMGLQAILVGTLDAKSDSKANSAEVTLDTQLINSVTGEVIHSSAASGAAAGAEGVPNDIVMERAAEDAATKVLPSLGIELVRPAAQSSPAGKGRTTRAQSQSSADRDAERKAKQEADAKRRADARAKRDAEEAEKAAAKAKREAERDAERAAEKAKRDAEKAKKAESAPAPKPVAETRPADTKRAAESKPAPAAETTPARTALEGPAVATKPADQQDAQPSQPPAATAGGSPNSVKGVANAQGQPVPYGYALPPGGTALPQRNRQAIKVPAWLGVAGFLTGLAFLL